MGFLTSVVDSIFPGVTDLWDGITGGAEAPDTSGINQSAVQSAETGRRALDAMLAELARTQEQRDTAASDASAISRAQLATMGQQNDLAREYADYNRETFRPLEMGIVRDAQAYDTPDRRNQEAGRAIAEMGMQRSAARDATTRQMASYGISPESAKVMAINSSQDINFARGAAGAAQGARDRVEATGRAMRMDAASLGRGLPSAQATAIQTGTNAANSAVGAGAAGVSASLSGIQPMQAGYGMALQGYGNAGNLYGRVAGIESDIRGQNLQFLSNMFSAATRPK